VYAVLSLTVIRMAPTAAALAGARLGRTAVVLVGWFGPRGLASVVFALLALEEIGQPAASQAVAVITGTGFQRGTRCTPTRRGTGAVARYHLPGMNRCAGAPA